MKYQRNSTYNTAQWNDNSTILIESGLSRKYRDAMLKRSKFQELIPDKQKNILDIGCGSGPFIKYFYQKGYRNLYGIDPEKELLEKIPENLAKIEVAFAENLPFESESFDAVFIYAVLHHLSGIDDYDKALKEASRVLKRGGYFFVMEPGHWRMFRAMEIGAKALSPFLKTFKALYQVIDEERPHWSFFIKNHSFVRDYFVRTNNTILVDKYFIYSWILTVQKTSSNT